MNSIFVDLEKFEISPYQSESLYLIFTIKIKTQILKKKILAEDKPHFIENSFLFFIVFFKDTEISGLQLDEWHHLIKAAELS